MARTMSTHHNWPDVHDEGRVKRYGIFIATGLVILLLALFVAWASDIGGHKSFASPPNDSVQN
jgi:hypothetical protein